ncbi:fasciclin domain-containing protein [Legionella sp. PATHC035]|uniref:fasciclin domain-containing protein n=1 Tax=Legionella sp. PATHC035 TaxID=2992040 RepID=UPI002242D8CD|nr:fasciclin domain-containing protein [Legionella sp. PATHC035]MCW8408883.1 fasciclin domain-containing protein [Legionella sp. PATHC035]
MKLIKQLFLVALISLYSFAASANDTIVNVAEGNKDFSTLVSLLKKAGLVSALEGKGPFTVFAPTNEAFASVPKADLDALLANPEKLKAVLLYHVVSGDVTSDKIKPGMVKTLSGQDVDVTVKEGKVFVNNAEVVKADVKASNGVIHVIDHVLIPKE